LNGVLQVRGNLVSYLASFPPASILGHLLVKFTMFDHYSLRIRLWADVDLGAKLVHAKWPSIDKSYWPFKAWWDRAGSQVGVGHIEKGPTSWLYPQLL